MAVLKVLKEENEVMELSIANGLFYILTLNCISCRLINKKSMYLIKIEDDVNYEEDLIFTPLELEKIDNINSTMNKLELEKMLNKINDIFSNNELLSKIFKYYETLDETYLNKDLKSKEGTIYIGTLSYTKGLRSYTTSGATSVKIPLYKKILSFLGFITATSYLQIKDVMEVNALLVPKDTDTYLQAEFITYQNKETGEVKKLRLISNKDAKTISLARLYLLSLKSLSKRTILENYNAILIMQVTPTKNKPLNDKIIELPVHDLSLGFIKELLRKVEYSTMNRDSKLSLCDYLLNQDFESFSNMICTFSKNNTIMMDKYFEEMINMRTDIEKNIYDNEDIKTLGRGLNRLINDKEGFSVQVSLLNCLNKQQLIECIRNLNLLYFKKYKRYLLNDSQYTNILDLAESTKTLKIVRDCILTYSTIYVDSIRNNKNIRLFGEKINKFIKDNNEANIIKDLLNCTNKDNLEDIIVDFNDLYKEKYEEDAIYDEGDLLDLVKDDKTLKIFLDTVLANSMRYTEIKRNLEKNKK